MAQIDYYLFPLSPYTYLAGAELEEIAARRGAAITYKPVQLMRIFAGTGTAPVGERPECRQAYRLADIERTARFRGMTVNPRPAFFPTNPVPASAAIIAAQEAGGGDVGLLCQKILSAVWNEEKDIAQDEVVGACLSAAGFDPAIAQRGLLSSVEALERNTDEALRRGVFGSPAYMVADEMFWGQDRLPQLDAYLAEPG